MDAPRTPTQPIAAMSFAPWAPKADRKCQKNNEAAPVTSPTATKTTTARRNLIHELDKM